MGNKEAKPQEKLEPVPLSVMLGQGNVFSATITKRERDDSGKVIWKEETKNYEIAGIPLEMSDEYFADQVSIGAQLFNLRDETSKSLQDKWLPLVVSRGKVGLGLGDLLKDGFDTKNLRELWRAVLDLSGF